MGGVNAAGRTSGHQAFRRTVLDALPAQEQTHTLLALAAMMHLVERQPDGRWLDTEGERLEGDEVVARYRQRILEKTLIRRIEPTHFDVDGIPANRQAQLRHDTPLVFRVRRRQLPEPLPLDWDVRELDNREVEVSIPPGTLDVLMPERRSAQVRTAGQLPSGFQPSELYRSVHHPRGLSMAVFGASDCLGQSGLDWERLRDSLDPDQIAVYAGNSIGQLDDPGWGGLLKSFVSGNRTTSKQMPLGYGQMPADFLNAYVLGSVGATGAVQGACASFLYNLRLGVEDIRSGRRRIVMVGTSDAPITPEVIEGFRAMGALADDDSLKALDALTLLTDADYQRACRPFARNCGFTIAEASQFLLLMDDTLALETGARILGSVPGVFVNADGWKRSISAPGIGNYITLGKAVRLATEMLGERAVRERSFVHAHATSTPKNRVTESHVLDEIARANQIHSWPVAGIKTFVGHSQGSAAGDQLASALGSFAHGLIPGLPHLDAVADDVYAERLALFLDPLPFTADVAFINAKGFGGNNATGVVLSPEVTERLLVQRHGQEAVTRWQRRCEVTQAASDAYLQRADAANFSVIYRFGEGVLEGPELAIDAQTIHIPGYAKPVSLAVDNPYGRLDDESCNEA
ncbi:beta-ketoacyl synthase [Halomonas sp. McH1-25]|uniref:beta-ketoacyl synthase n=1 Tax=unclassified Halomonas TaxID=2609666 RepID=UPI001EF43275|nr:MULTISPECIES: beta-ketoacyl synthase N-terminal-like domain-containing protein [unclassified Halomonas]MCG7601420.1 beta-ketoacyl synthase [Halomonas sp. McH1-25]MCP1341961.1 beta-ketoacyl synthase [Halomonas sp. FL8]MCP1362301.1 beta-ketoacyl synthase [Halomonas sp. BBD45]